MKKMNIRAHVIKTLRRQRGFNCQDCDSSDQFVRVVEDLRQLEEDGYVTLGTPHVERENGTFDFILVDLTVTGISWLKQQP